MSNSGNSSSGPCAGDPEALSDAVIHLETNGEDENAGLASGSRGFDQNTLKEGVTKAKV